MVQSIPSRAELRMRGAIPLLTVRAFMACEGKTSIVLVTKMISKTSVAFFSNDIFEDSGHL
jgi:hypothetical protein